MKYNRETIQQPRKIFIFLQSVINNISNLIINWGGKTLTVGDNVINLPIAYPSDRRGIAITPFYPNNATVYPQTYGAFFKTGVAPLSTINIYASVSMYVAWFVIGY